jgi:hypothetical protein
MKKFLFYSIVFLVSLLISGLGMPGPSCTPPGCEPGGYYDIKMREAMNMPPGYAEAQNDCEDCIRQANVARREVHYRVTAGYTNDDLIQDLLRQYNLDPDQRKTVEDCLRRKNKGYLGGPK